LLLTIDIRMAAVFFLHLIQAVLAARDSIRIAIQVMTALEIALDNKLQYLLALYTYMQDMEARVKAFVETNDMVTLNVRGTLFVVKTEHLTASPNIFFQALVYSNLYPKEHYFIDRPYEGFDRIVNALKGEKLSYEGLNDYEAQCVESNLIYFRLPFPRFTRRFQKEHRWRVCEGRIKTAISGLRDGRLCTGLYDGVIKVWNTSTYECELKLLGHSHRINVIIHLKDGRICTASDDSTIKLWNLVTGECEATLEGHDDAVTALVQGSSNHLYSGSSDRTIRVWGLHTGLSLKWICTHGDVKSLEILPNGRVASLSISKKCVQVWDVDIGQCTLTIDDVVKIIQLGSGNLCTSSSVGLLTIWDYITGQRIKSIQLPFQVFDTRVTSLLLLRDGRVCITFGYADDDIEDEVKLSWLFNMETEKIEQEFEESVERMVQLADGRLCSGRNFREVTVWK
jgi:WD40 repeat protein